MDRTSFNSSQNSGIYVHYNRHVIKNIPEGFEFGNTLDSSIKTKDYSSRRSSASNTSEMFQKYKAKFERKPIEKELPSKETSESCIKCFII
jgi:hypothetical protein